MLTLVLGVWVRPQGVGDLFFRAWWHRLVKFELWDGGVFWVGNVLMRRTLVVGRHGDSFGWQHPQAYADLRSFREAVTVDRKRHSSWNLVSSATH